MIATDTPASATTAPARESAMEETHVDSQLDSPNLASVLQQVGQITLDNNDEPSAISELNFRVKKGDRESIEEARGLKHANADEKLDLECSVCAGRFPIESYPVIDGCVHPTETCGQCLDTWVDSQLDTTIVKDGIRCPSACGRKLSYADLRGKVSSKTFNRFEVSMTRAALREVPKYRECMAQSCKSGRIHDPAVDGNIFCCSECGFRVCTTHEVPFHDGETCEEYNERTKIVWKKQEEQSIQTISRISKPCPNCQVNIQKTQGCDEMTCSRCGHIFCYLCMESYLGRDGILEIGNTAHVESCAHYHTNLRNNYANNYANRLAAEAAGHRINYALYQIRGRRSRLTNVSVEGREGPICADSTRPERLMGQIGHVPGQSRQIRQPPFRSQEDPRAQLRRGRMIAPEDTRTLDEARILLDHRETVMVAYHGSRNTATNAANPLESANSIQAILAGIRARFQELQDESELAAWQRLVESDFLYGVSNPHVLGSRPYPNDDEMERAHALLREQREALNREYQRLRRQGNLTESSVPAGTPLNRPQQGNPFQRQGSHSFSRSGSSINHPLPQESNRVSSLRDPPFSRATPPAWQWDQRPGAHLSRLEDRTYNYSANTHGSHSLLSSQLPASNTNLPSGRTTPEAWRWFDQRPSAHLSRLDDRTYTKNDANTRGDNVLLSSRVPGNTTGPAPASVENGGNARLNGENIDIQRSVVDQLPVPDESADEEEL